MPIIALDILLLNTSSRLDVLRVKRQAAWGVANGTLRKAARLNVDAKP